MPAETTCATWEFGCCCTALDQFLHFSPVEKFREHGLENLRLARRQAETPVLVHDHCHGKDGQRDKTTHHGGPE
jgi:hypothetical protein